MTLVLPALVLAGCTVGPDYTAPATKLPSAFDAPQLDAAVPVTTTTGHEAELDAWWRLLHDEQLDRLVQAAAVGNLDLAAAAARVQQARASRAIVAGGLWPQGNLTGGVQRGQTASAFGGGAARTTYQAGFDASWELDLFGGIRRDLEAADADTLALVEDRRDVLVTLTSEVAFNYISLRGLQRRLEVARTNLDAQWHTVDITQRKFDAGLTNRLDVVEAQSLVATTKAQIPSLQAAAQQAIFNLGVLLGSDPTSQQERLAVAGAIPQVPTTLPVGVPVDVVRRRPDLRRAEASLHAATARIGVATANLYPHLTVSGVLGFQNGKLPGLFDDSQRSWSLAAGLLAPLFAGGSLRAGVARSEAVADEAMQQYRAAVLGALRDVDGALHTFGREQERLAALREAVVSTRQALDLATRLYAEGGTDFLSVLDAQRALLSAEDAEAQSEAAAATDLVTLCKALGGGWQTFAPES